MELYQRILVIFVSAIAISGILGNTLVIAVFCSRKSCKMTSTDIFIIALASTGLLFCLMLPVIAFQIYYERNSCIHLCRLYYFEMYFPLYNSILLCVAIAVDRFFAISKPHKKILSPFRAKIVVLICLLLSTVYYFQFFSSLTVMRIIPGDIANVTETNENMTSNIVNALSICRPNTITFIDRIVKGFASVSYFIWLGIIALLYIKIYFQLRKRMKIRVTMNAETERSAPESIRPSAEEPELSQPQNPASGASISNTADGGAKYTESEISEIYSKMSTFVSTANIETNNNINTDVNLPKRKTSKPNLNRVKTQYSAKTTKMLFVVTAVTYITWLPSAFVYAVSGAVGINENLKVLSVFLKHLFLVSHISNPIIYGLVSKRFREESRTVCRKIKTVCRSK